MSKQSRTVERRRAREKRRRRNRQLTILGAVIVIVIIAAVLAITANQPAEAPTPGELTESYEGLQRSTTEEGFPRLGDPQVPVRVVEISSFDCPHCRDFHEDVVPSLLDRVREDEITFTYVPLFGTGSIPNGQGAARAAVCAGEQGKFWEMHSVLFFWAGQYGSPFVTNRLSAGIENLGLDQDTFSQCFDSANTTAVLNAASQFASNKGESFTGTPSVYVNGALVDTPSLEDVQAAIDRALALAAPSEATEEPTAEVTSEATPEAEGTEEPAAEVTEAADD